MKPKKKSWKTTILGVLQIAAAVTAAMANPELLNHPGTGALLLSAGFGGLGNVFSEDEHQADADAAQ